MGCHLWKYVCQSHSKRRTYSGRRRDLRGKVSGLLERHTKCEVPKGQIRNGDVVLSKEPRNCPRDVTNGPLFFSGSERLARIWSQELVGTLVCDEYLKKRTEKVILRSPLHQRCDIPLRQPKGLPIQNLSRTESSVEDCPSLRWPYLSHLRRDRPKRLGARTSKVIRPIEQVVSFHRWRRKEIKLLNT